MKSKRGTCFAPSFDARLWEPLHHLALDVNLHEVRMVVSQVCLADLIKADRQKGGAA